MGVGPTNRTQQNRPTQSAAPASSAAPAQPQTKVTTKDEKKSEVKEQDGYRTATESQSSSRTSTTTGPGVSRPTTTTTSSSRRREFGSGVKRDGGSVEARAHTEDTRKAEVSHSRGDGPKAGDVRKQASGGHTIAEKKGETRVSTGTGAEWNKTTETGAGTVTQNAQVNAGASAGASGSAAVTTNGVTVKGAADVKVGVDGSYTIKFQSKEVEVGGQKIRADFELKLSAEAVAKAGGQIEVAATGNPPQAAVSVGGKAFAGVSAGAELSASVKWVKGGGQEVELAKATGSAEAHAGAGIEGRLDIGYSGGKLRLDAYAGATLGLGASAGVKAEVNPTAAAEFALAVGQNLAVEYGGKVLDAVRDVGTAVVNKAEEVGTAVVNKAEEVGTTIVNTASDVGTAIKDSPYAPWNW